MSRLACSVEGCTRPHHAQGYCNTHYYRLVRTGEVGASAVRVRHVLTELDREEQTAVCSVCGPTKVYIRGASAQCRTAKRGAGPRKPEPYRPRPAESQRAARLRWKYGIEPQDYDRMLAEQEGLCAICGEHMPQPHVDHNHVTGAVRGLLCGPCNRGIGHFGEDVSRMSAAIRYLDRHRRPTI